jgi:predicted transcriptional regulator
VRAAQLAAPRRDAVVAELMSQPVLTVEVTETLWDAWQLLFVSGLRHLVVLNEDGSSLGVLSDRNILAEVPATAALSGSTAR